MYNQEKLGRFSKLISVVVCVIILIVGILIGVGIQQPEKETKNKTNETTVKKEKETVLTTDTVNDFLIAYYTKKDLEENRSRYKPLVTTSMMNQLITTEEEPVNQAYKGYIVNQVFEKADIYVDTVNSSAIAMVTYKNTQRATKGSDENALQNQTNQEAIKLTFLKQGKEFLVNRMDYISLTQPLSQSRNTYKATNTVEGVQSIEQTTEEKEALDKATLDKATKESKTKEEAKTDESTKESK